MAATSAFRSTPPEPETHTGMTKHTPKTEPEYTTLFEGTHVLQLLKKMDDGTIYVSGVTLSKMEQQYSRAIRRAPDYDEVHLTRRVLTEGDDNLGGPLFRLARALKAEPWRTWCKTAQHGFPHALLMADYGEFYDKPVFMAGEGDTCSYDEGSITAMFEEAWDCVKFGENETLLSQALKNSEGSKLFREVTNANRRKVIALAFELQRLRGDEPIFLPQEKLGKLLKMPQQEVSVHLKRAVKDEYLKRLSEGDRLSKRAGVYRFSKAVKGTRTVNVGAAGERS